MSPVNNIRLNKASSQKSRSVGGKIASQFILVKHSSDANLDYLGSLEEEIIIYNKVSITKPESY